MKRPWHLVLLTTLAVLATASAQPSMGTIGAGSSIFELMTSITALREMQTETDHPLEPEQARVVLGALEAARDADVLTAEVADVTMSAIEEALSPQQLVWLDMRLLAPTQSPQAGGGRTFGGSGATAPGTVVRRSPSDWQAGESGTPGQRGMRTSAQLEGNPLRQPPFSTNLQSLMELLEAAVQ